MTELPYQIIVINEQMGVDDTGRLQNYKVVHYRTALGDTGTVRIPVTDFSADAVKALIEADVTEQAKLRGM
jgi:hypothetical protein